MRFFLYLSLLWMFGSMAAAQDISVHMDEIPLGSTITYRNSDNRVFTHRFVGRKGNSYVWNVYEGKRPIGAPATVNYFDDQGNIQKFSDSSGRTTNYDPHRCMRVIGKCRFTITLEDGTKTSLVRTNTPTAKGFRYQVVDQNGAIVLQGSAVRGPSGWSKRFWFIGRENRKIRLKMIASSF